MNVSPEQREELAKILDPDAWVPSRGGSFPRAEAAVEKVGELLNSDVFAAVVRAAQADAWDECAQALGWALNNGPAESAAAYVAEANPYREGSK